MNRRERSTRRPLTRLSRSTWLPFMVYKLVGHEHLHRDPPSAFAGRCSVSARPSRRRFGVRQPSRRRKRSDCFSVSSAISCSNSPCYPSRKCPSCFELFLSSGRLDRPVAVSPCPVLWTRSKTTSVFWPTVEPRFEQEGTESTETVDSVVSVYLVAFHGLHDGRETPSWKTIKRTGRQSV